MGNGGSIRTGSKLSGTGAVLLTYLIDGRIQWVVMRGAGCSWRMRGLRLERLRGGVDKRVRFSPTSRSGVVILAMSRSIEAATCMLVA